MHNCRSYGPDKLNLLPFYHLTCKSDLDHHPTWRNVSNDTATPQGEQLWQMTLLFHKEKNCVKLFWNPSINVEIMAQTSSIYDDFIIWPSSVTLTFNLPIQMFQTALVLVKENTCAKLFWNPCINVEVMAQRNLDERATHVCILIHWTDIVTTKSRSLQAGS